jgi:hypothetical protein
MDMNMLALLLAISAIEWYVIENLKKNVWGSFSWGQYATIAVSLIASFALAFSFKLDILVAVGLIDAVSEAGIILTGFVLSSGSSAIAELLEAIGGVSAKIK